MCMFCRSLFVLFLWPLCCLFFFDIRILITSLWYLQILLLIQTVDSNNLGKYYYFGGLKMNSMSYRELLIFITKLVNDEMK